MLVYRFHPLSSSKQTLLKKGKKRFLQKLHDDHAHNTFMMSAKTLTIEDMILLLTPEKYCFMIILINRRRS
jgi:hypothetical protein